MADIGVNFIRNTLANINNMPIVDGQVLWTTDQGANNKIYNDNGTERIVIGGSNTVDTELSTTSDNAIANKIITVALNTEITARQNADYNQYHATFAAASFVAVTVTKSDGTTTVTEYKCTVSVSGIVAAMQLSDLEYKPTGVPDTDEITKGIYGTIVSYESGAETVSVYMSAAPSADIILYFKGRKA